MKTKIIDILYPLYTNYQGRAKIYRVPGPGPSTGGEDFFLKKRDFFSEKIRGGAKTFLL